MRIKGTIWTQFVRLCIVIATGASITVAAQTVELTLIGSAGQRTDAVAKYSDALYSSSANSYAELLRATRHLHSSEFANEETAYRTAVSYMDAGSNALAERYLTVLLQNSQRSTVFDAFANAALGTIYVRTKRYSLAAQAFRAATDTSHEFHFRKVQSNTDAPALEIHRFSMFWLANSLLLVGNADAALEQYAKIIADSASEHADDARYAVAQILEDRNNNDEAFDIYSGIIRDYPDGNVILSANIRAAQCLIRRREYSNALTRLAVAEELVNTLAKTTAVAASSQPSSQSSTTSPALQTQWEIKDADARVHYLKGEALHAVGLYSSALKEFEQVFTKPSVDKELRHRARFGAGVASMAQKRWSESITLFDSVIADSATVSSNTLSASQLFKGLALKWNDSRSQAIQLFRACAGDERFVYPERALLELGQMYYEDAAYDRAKAVLHKAVLQCNDPVTEIRSLLLLASMHMEAREWLDARTCYDKAEIKLRRTSADVLPWKEVFDDEIRLKRGIAHHEDGKHREAINDLTAYLSRHPADARADEALFWLSETFYNAQLLKNAIESYRKLVMNFGASSRREEALYGLGWSLFKMREFDSSGAVFANLLSEFPQTRFAGDVYVRKGDALYLTKKYADASKEYRSAAALIPQGELHEYAKFQVGQSLYRAKEYKASVQELQSFLREHPSSTFSDHALYTIAYTYSLQEKHSDALQAFEQLTRTYPRSELVPAALYYAANAQYANGEYEDAVQRYRSLMGLYPSTFYGIEALRGLQESLSLLGRNDEAIEVGKAYVQANPNGNVQEQISMKTIEIFMRKGDYGNAAKEYQDFLKKYPDSELSAEAMFLLAKSQMGMGDMDAARQTLSLLYSKYESSDFASQGVMQLALLELKRANVSRADSLFDLVIRKYSGTELAAHATYEQANLAMGRGDTARALNLYANAGLMNAGEFSQQAMYRTAMYYRSQNADDSSRKYFRMVSTSSDNTSLAAECVYRIGESYLSLRDYANAMIAFDEVRRAYDGIEDWYTLSLIGLGECYEKSGSTAKAREIYQTVIILHPSDDYGTTAQSRLKRLR